jgi:hypothetical protein
MMVIRAREPAEVIELSLVTQPFLLMSVRNHVEVNKIVIHANFPA